MTEPHVAAGPGGTTRLWHNGLIEIDESVFERHWPFAKSTLDGYYATAFALLSGGASLASIHACAADLRKQYKALGLPDGLLPGLFYPRWPFNLWDKFGLASRVRLVQAEVTGFELGPQGQVVALHTSAGRVEGDRFVLAAGGLGTPLLLQALAASHPLPALAHAGCHYEDHPMAFVGEVQVSVPLYKLWNHAVRGGNGNLRMPLVVQREGLHVSFQLRPAATVSLSTRRQRVDTVLNELRRKPWNLALYLQLLKHPDDLLDILSFKFGVHLPTRHYTVLMVAQMPTRPERDVWGEAGAVQRRWVLPEAYLQLLRESIDELLHQLAPVVRASHLFPDWPGALRSAAHHSGTARLSRSAEHGVCDADARVHGMPNLYVCDGSLIPASGIANTGLSIAALALRLADHLRHGAGSGPPAGP
jgi:GMC oxidoreductase